MRDKLKLTEYQKLLEIVKFVRYQGIRLQICQKPQRKDHMPNGWYQDGVIRVYTKNSVAFASETASMILHEYGHHLAQICIGHRHTEHDAWDLAAKAVPSSYRPNQFKRMRSLCLQSYAQVGID